MNVLEEKYMTQMPSVLARIAKALEGINEKLELLTKHTEEPAPEVSTGSDAKNAMREDPIAKVINEVSRIEDEELAERRKHDPNAQRIGYATRFFNGCKQAEIETVDDLLNFGYRNFKHGLMRYAGKSLADRVSKALENLYGIKEW